MSAFILNFPVQLLLPFSADEVLSILRQVLSAHEVNWKHLLSCVAAFVVLFEESRLLIGPLLFSGLRNIVSLTPTKILYVGFLRQSFASALEETSSEDFLAAMLVSRQATIEGEPFFLSYNSLFQVSFHSQMSTGVRAVLSILYFLSFRSFSARIQSQLQTTRRSLWFSSIISTALSRSIRPSFYW